MRKNTFQPFLRRFSKEEINMSNKIKNLSSQLNIFLIFQVIKKLVSKLKKKKIIFKNVVYQYFFFLVIIVFLENLKNFKINK